MPAPLGIPVAHADPNDDNPNGHNRPSNSNDVHVSKITPRGCEPSLPMTGTN